MEYTSSKAHIITTTSKSKNDIYSSDELRKKEEKTKQHNVNLKAAD